MAKECIPGQVKTRLTPPLSHTLAADVAAASLEDRPRGPSVQRLALSLNPPIPFEIIRRSKHEMLAHWAKQLAASGQFQVAVETLRTWLPRTAVSVDHFYVGLRVMPITGVSAQVKEVCGLFLSA